MLIDAENVFSKIQYPFNSKTTIETQQKKTKTRKELPSPHKGYLHEAFEVFHSR